MYTLLSLILTLILSAGAPSTDAADALDDLSGMYWINQIDVTGVRYPEDPESLTQPAFYRWTSTEEGMTIEFHPDGTYTVDGAYTMTETLTYGEQTRTSSTDVTTEYTNDNKGTWEVQGERLLMTNDTFLRGLMSNGSEVGPRVSFELNILQLTEDQVTLEILSSIDFSPTAGYPARMDVQGTIGLDR